ncbi:MAG: ankyrin repeat domain-containing protein [Wolbachia endosymbiont of Xenopsylla cheopis]
MEGGFTALHLACARRDWSHIKLLIEGGASLEIRDNNDMTPLDVLNLSDIERLKIIDQGLSCDDKSTVKDYDSYVNDVNGQEKIATFCKQTFYRDPNILKNKINQDYSVNNLYIQKSVKHEDFHQQHIKSSASIKRKLEDFDPTNNKLKTINASKTAISLKQVKKVETLNAPKPTLIQVKPLQRDKFRYGIAGAAFLAIGIGLVVTSLYIDLRVMITAVAAYILAGYYAYKAYKCIQNEKRMVSNSNLPSVEEQVIDILVI